ncbi:MAG: nicotinamide mononucleotide transporter [Phycisphaeraceae bacterium]|nr:nicotinamide mononucleotide transporter [Phycisphaerales bacterium]MCB9859570.1 nicotinamide mononucleotide transporter [Phycisphaeraceae bacterium]
MPEWLTESIIQHHGIDWIAMAMNFLCYHHLGSKRRSGFIFGILASVAWLVFNFTVGSFAGVVANGVFVWLNLRGWLRWESPTQAPA